jgi:hypothetical protein
MSLTITNNPRLNLAVVTGDTDNMTAGNVCLASCSNNLSLETHLACSNYSVNLESEWSVGYGIDVKSAFANADDFNLIQFANDSNDFVLDGILAEVAFKKCGDFTLTTGCSSVEGGWFREDCRTYLGEGANYNSNPLIFDVDAFGMKGKFSSKGFTFYGDVLNSGEDARAISGGSPAANGLLGSRTPLYCDVGVVYRNEKIACPVCINMHCQRFDNRNGTGSVQLAGGHTAKAASAIADTVARDDSINALTGIISTDYEGFELNAALTCANTRALSTDTAQDDGRVLRWSVGCLTKCKKIHCLPDENGKIDAYGMVVSTPTYLQKKNGDDDAEDRPLTCEAYVLAEVCGINLPIALTYVDNKEGTKTGDGQGSACVLSIRPNLVTEHHLDGRVVDIVKCGVEGSLDEDEE